MIELRWRLAKGGCISKPVDSNFVENGAMTSVFVSEEANSIQMADGRHVILQMRQKIPWTQNRKLKTWGEWEDVELGKIGIDTR